MRQYADAFKRLVWQLSYVSDFSESIRPETVSKMLALLCRKVREDKNIPVGITAGVYKSYIADIFSTYRDKASYAFLFSEDIFTFASDQASGTDFAAQDKLELTRPHAKDFIWFAGYAVERPENTHLQVLLAFQLPIVVDKLVQLALKEEIEYNRTESRTKREAIKRYIYQAYIDPLKELCSAVATNVDYKAIIDTGLAKIPRYLTIKLVPVLKP